jgi:hypothetical protein
MNAAVRRMPVSPASGQKVAAGRIDRKSQLSNFEVAAGAAAGTAKRRSEKPMRVYVAAENRLLREALSRMLMRACGHFVAHRARQPGRRYRGDSQRALYRSDLWGFWWSERRKKKPNFFSTFAREFAATCRETQLRTTCWRRCRPVKRFARGHCARCSFGFLNAKPLPCPRQACIRSWD